MQHLDYIKDQLELIKVRINKLDFKEDDIRKDFHGLIWDVLDNYYRGFTYFALTKYIADGQVKFDKELENLEDHLKHLTGVMSDPELFASARNNLNRSIILDSWSVFEFCVSIITGYILKENVIIDLLAEDFQKVIKILKSTKVDTNSQAKLEKTLVKQHLAHVSINRKYNKLFSSVKSSYCRDINEDKQFLLFLGKYRNCMHSNYFYFGNYFEYEFGGVAFYFKNGEPIWNNKKYGIDLHFNIILELMEVFSELMDKLDYDALIPYPGTT